MDNENEEIRDLHNAFGENQRESMDPGLNGFNSQNFLDLHNGQISRESMNPIFNPFQPNNSSQDLTNQNQNILDKEKEDENQNEETSNNKGNDSENKKSPKASKRRSKSEVEGRTFECKLCNKRYLSYPALYTHCKQKHKQNNSSGRGRGRPKKEGIESEAEKNKFNPINQTYFSKEERNGKTEPNEMNDCIDTVFKELYSEENKERNEIRKMKFYTSIEQHPFLNKFKNDEHDINKNLQGENECTDNVLMNYLNKMSQFCNPTYFTKLIKFVTLFREHVNSVNIVNGNDNGIPKEYTETNNAEDVPDSSNEFITDFLDPDTREEDFGFSKEESIDLTQNLCYWMYDNNFTCSKLSLIHTENRN